jgi:acyl-coenzyme A synthetase/AMP-(fatty) acid ligase
VNQCTYYHVPKERKDPGAAIPIGRVWPNTEGIVVDANDQPVSNGESGELLIRGPTMMRGYWERPELNQKAFFYRSITADVSDRFYRTGDLVETDKDGELSFLGRKDRQIKIRGHRVELDEVEAALASHASVQEAASYDIPNIDSSLLVEAAVVLKNDAITISNKELKDYVSNRLPVYAVPHDVKIMDRFPRTTSGKIDRRRLREMAISSTTKTSV